MGEPLRRIDLESFPHIRSKLVTVVLVPQDGEPIYAVTVGRKRELFRAYRKGDALIATWLGRYTADAFLVDADALSEWVAALID